MLWVGAATCTDTEHTPAPHPHPQLSGRRTARGQVAGSWHIAGRRPLGCSGGRPCYHPSSGGELAAVLTPPGLTTGAYPDVHAACSLAHPIPLEVRPGLRPNRPSTQAIPERLIALTGTDPQLVPLAAVYARIRALAQPAVLLSMVAQGGLLAQRDSRAPCAAVLAAVAVSLAGNVITVGCLGWGLAGAASTTVLAQLMAAALLLRALTSQHDDRVTPAWRQLPQVPDLVRLAVTVGPLSIAYLSKNLCYGLIQTTAASMEVVHLAAHQVCQTCGQRPHEVSPNLSSPPCVAHVFKVWMCCFLGLPASQGRRRCKFTVPPRSSLPAPHLT
jgi:hypothetical protein